MANNGYLVDSVCVGDVQAKFVLSCPSGTYIFYNGYVLPSSLGSGTCYSKNISTGALTALKTVPVPVFDCEIPGPIPPSKIPTVADGIALGWQAGAALILVGCILFLKKALK